MASVKEDRIPMRELERLTGLTRMTINFYIKEGLLPEPEKTAQNMAYYNQTFVDRLRLIFKLRSEYHFSLAQIREILESDQDESDLALLLDVRDRIFRRISTREEEKPVTWDELIQRTGLDAETLEWMQAGGLIISEQHPDCMDGTHYHSDSVAMGQLIRRLFDLGVTRDEMDPFIPIMNQIAVLQKRLIEERLPKELDKTDEVVQRAVMMVADITSSLVSLAVLRKVYHQLDSGNSEH